MKTIHPDYIKDQLNNCFEAFDPYWQDTAGSARQRNGFKYHVEHTAGLRLDFEPEVRLGKVGYKINTVEIIDEPLFTMWMLKWA